MKQEEIKDKALHDLFVTLERGNMPVGLNTKITQAIFVAQRKRERRNIVLLVLFCLVLVGATMVCIHYLTDIKWVEIFKMPTLNIDNFGWSFSLFIGGLALILLLVDSQLRKLINHKKHR